MSSPIRVFVSYSGDDWLEHVEPLASHLTENGIETSAANWDIHGGDSIADWILNHGIPRAEVIVVVLSESSVNRPWVKEELDHAAVRRIEDQVRVIPFRIDNCDIPPSLRTLKRISVHNHEEWGEKLDELVDAIYRRSRKPPLGAPPAYTQRETNYFPELSPLEDTVLSEACKQCLESGYRIVKSHALLEQLNGVVSEEQLNKTIHRLVARGVVTGKMHAGGGYGTFDISLEVATHYSNEIFPDFLGLQKHLGAVAADLGPNSLSRVVAPEGVPPFVFMAAIESLESRGWFKLMRHMGGGYRIHAPSPFIEDWLEQL